MSQGSGRQMAAEIQQQPEIFAELYAQRDQAKRAAEWIKLRAPRFVLLAARGSSDHAALYGKYLVEVLLQQPAGLVSPSTVTLYGAQPALSDVLVITISQSGASPDLVEFTRQARQQGAATLALTNTADSALTRAAEWVLPILAGPERAVAATKSYTATLLTLYLLIDALRGGDGSAAAKLPELASYTLRTCAEPVASAVERYREIPWMITTGRGYSSATAAEAALKLTETSYQPTRAYSGADLLHGPLAGVDEETVVLGICPRGRTVQAMAEVCEAVGERGAEACVIGSGADLLPADMRIELPICREELSPLLEILPLQLFAHHLALVHGTDPDQPRGLTKVTRTL